MCTLIITDALINIIIIKVIRPGLVQPVQPEKLETGHVIGPDMSFEEGVKNPDINSLTWAVRP